MSTASAPVAAKSAADSGQNAESWARTPSRSLAVRSRASGSAATIAASAARRRRPPGRITRHARLDVELGAATDTEGVDAGVVDAAGVVAVFVAAGAVVTVLGGRVTVTRGLRVGFGVGAFVVVFGGAVDVVGGRTVGATRTRGADGRAGDGEGRGVGVFAGVALAGARGG